MKARRRLRWSLVGWLSGSLLAGVALVVGQFFALSPQSGAINFIASGLIPYVLLALLVLGLTRLLTRLFRGGPGFYIGLAAALTLALPIALVIAIEIGRGAPRPFAGLGDLASWLRGLPFLVSGAIGALADSRVTAGRVRDDADVESVTAQFS